MPSRITMYANFSSAKNTTVGGRVEYPDKRCPTQGPPLTTVSSECLHPLDKPSCSSQQKLMFEEYNQNNNFDIYNMDAPTGSALKPCNTDFKKTSCKQQKVDLPTKFNEIKQDSLKSPIAKLNEIMLLKKQVVEYGLISITGHVHNPVFRFVAVNDGIYAYGDGLSKKEAKKNAAIALLDKLDDINGNNTITSTTSNISPSNVSPLKYSKENVLDEISKVNPIGVLQELCMARRWELPDYDFPQDERNEAHNVWYSVVCSLRDLKSVGEGKTKQAAKRQAAHIMYDLIKNIPQQSISKAREYVYPTPRKMMQDMMESKDFNCINNLKSLEIFLNRLKSSQNPSLNKLRNTDSTVEIRKNAIKFLETIGEEEHFCITYLLMSNKSFDIEIVVQLAVTPLLLFIGSGRTTEDAKEMAAYVALTYLKLLLQ
ncbi:interferon-inducible double-stranded RNA-dependent protein kinase activator A isoform X2 [Acyrthosiphon pisum]|nr:interferon-inducible double-stranded RNA-dependent protein kinase activator A isoform X2 [Acyrthosiphon pisum]XP_016660397.1 interferon-inducible double-stranded RNA-dependent protein kinase activator A isoform X2 [Acyrthosiphon pisum]|eukprot:XP_001942593.2 PREDICTED: interferon-inducible double-stranded RNA-dependent protein kinase activator A isoform X2 [Acyrthosiphon pisum]